MIEYYGNDHEYHDDDGVRDGGIDDAAVDTGDESCDDGDIDVTE